MNVDDIAARHKRGEAITEAEHAALTASRRLPCPYFKLGRGTAKTRRWDAHFGSDGHATYGKHAA